MEEKRKKFREFWARYKFVLLTVLVGIVLLAWPSSGGASGKNTGQTQSAQLSSSGAQSLETTETKMEQILSRIDGVGNLQLMLTEESAGEEQLAQNTELSYSGDPKSPDEYSRKSETVVLSNGDGDAAVITKNAAPTYRGALVVCQGAENAKVKLAVTQAVAALTGLSSDRITVVKCQ